MRVDFVLISCVEISNSSSSSSSIGSSSSSSSSCSSSSSNKFKVCKSKHEQAIFHHLPPLIKSQSITNWCGGRQLRGRKGQGEGEEVVCPYNELQQITLIRNTGVHTQDILKYLHCHLSYNLLMNFLVMIIILLQEFM